ncbi:MAG: NAD(P)/FAD-dependent oxidoreductase [Methanobacteriaceae archaeon]|nr:NAD(P)/FAD-dependent oxidoreductase [Methanobacteriaceae archaeon]
MKIYDIAVVGAGAAGLMAAIQASASGKSVILLEKNSDIGRKILITGNGRCNLTNNAPLDVFLRKFGKHGSFFRTAFTAFSNHDLMQFFKTQGLNLKVESNHRVFPVTDRSQSVLDVLKNRIKENRVKIIYNCRVMELKKFDKYFELHNQIPGDGPGHHHQSKDIIHAEAIKASRVILSTGGASYPKTGSTGDGYHITEYLNHTITPLKPGLVPLKVQEEWPRSLKGVVLTDVTMTFKYGTKRKIKKKGDLLFTHFGISGPALLDLSRELVDIIHEEGEVKLSIDLMPHLSLDDLEELLLSEFKEYHKKDIQNYLRFQLPTSFVKPLLNLLDIDPHKKLNQISKKERFKLLENIKTLSLTINGHLPLSKAMITCGGVSKKEIDPQTMESRVLKGLYITGEIIEGCAPSGGYNLQQAFSTGFLAGESASKSLY